jgi:hypothetical protein
VPDEKHLAESMVNALRSLLIAQVGGDQVQENRAFRSTAMPVMMGIALYKLNVDVLEVAEPALHAQFSPHMDEDDWFGCVIRPNTDSNSDMLMDSVHIGRAKAAFNALWASGRPL